MYLSLYFTIWLRHWFWIGYKNYDSCEILLGDYAQKVCSSVKFQHHCVCLCVERNFPFVRTDDQHVDEPHGYSVCIHIYYCYHCSCSNAILHNTFFLVPPAQRFPADTRDFIVALEL